MSYSGKRKMVTTLVSDVRRLGTQKTELKNNIISIDLVFHSRFACSNPET